MKKRSGNKNGAHRRAVKPAEAASFYRDLLRIRRAEEEIARLYPTDKIKSPVHLSIGQEFVSVGVCRALRPEDVVFGTYRGHALYLAKGGDLNALMAELFGKVTGCAKGKGGSMHLIDPDHGVMGTSAVVATTIPQAVGHAYAVKLRKEPVVVVSFFGDGAVDEGVFHESLNFAALKELPILFVCENNFYAIHTHVKRRQPKENISEHARLYDVSADRVTDGDVLKVYGRARHAVEWIRERGKGPRFLECHSYRWKQHVGPNEDWKLGYRSKREAQPWIRNDQVRVLGERLDERSRGRIRDEVEKEIAAAIDFAERSPFPPDDELYKDVYAPRE